MINKNAMQTKGEQNVDKVNAQASEMAAHNAHMKQLLDTLKAEGIAENTLSDHPAGTHENDPGVPASGIGGHAEGRGTYAA